MPLVITCTHLAHTHPATTPWSPPQAVVSIISLILHDSWGLVWLVTGLASLVVMGAPQVRRFASYVCAQPGWTLASLGSCCMQAGLPSVHCCTRLARCSNAPAHHFGCLEAPSGCCLQVGETLHWWRARSQQEGKAKP